MSWTRKLFEPITLKDGRKIVALEDARVLMVRVPELVQLRPHWQYAGELVLEAAENNRASIKTTWAQLRRVLSIEGML
jgi:hypothetical protein